MAKEGLNAMRRNCLASFQKLRRMQCAVDGYCRCISCGKIGHWKTMDGGHYIPRAVRALELEPDNVWAQCKRCNAFLEGNTTEYRKSLIEKIGLERVEELEADSNKWQRGKSKGERKDIAYYKEKRREYEREIKRLQENW